MLKIINDDIVTINNHIIQLEEIIWKTADEYACQVKEKVNA